MAGIQDLLGGLLNKSTVGGLLGLGADYLSTEEGIQAARALPQQAQNITQQLLSQAGEATQFQPFAVTSTPQLGGFTVGQTGDITLQPGAGVQALSEQALTGAGGVLSGLLAPRAQREQEIYQALEAARAPQREREMLAEEQRLYSQGRIGTQSSMFGGATPETLARMQAIEEQRSKDVLAAMNQASAEQEAQQGLLGTLFETAYAPQTQTLGLMQATAPFQQFIESGRLGTKELYGEALTPIIGAAQAGLTGETALRQQQLEALSDLLGREITAQGQVAGSAVSGGTVGEAVAGAVGDIGTDIYNWIFGEDGA
jgi:hypothetical protein